MIEIFFGLPDNLKKFRLIKRISEGENYCNAIIGYKTTAVSRFSSLSLWLLGVCFKYKTSVLILKETDDI